ncbi:MAG: family 43 glycosylhydrolase [Candidatus Omnitrophica bacterium]|nr:family 43 glycosylhydrolase [Candidatus Omnitrophota bacterium]
MNFSYCLDDGVLMIRAVLITFTLLSGASPVWALDAASGCRTMPLWALRVAQPSQRVDLARALGANAGLEGKADGKFSLAGRPGMDPSVFRMGRNYFVVSGARTTEGYFPILISSNLRTWSHSGFVFSPGNVPKWAKQNATWDDFWAPNMCRIGSRYALYYTARDRTGHLCIGVAFARRPSGPWADSGGPIVREDRVGHIDPYQFRDPKTGRHFLLWKEDGNDLGGNAPTPIYIQRLSGDGGKLLDQRQIILDHGPDPDSWEGPLVEAPSLAHRRGKYYLFYSANTFFNERYAVGIARSDSLTGPYEKYPGGPILRSNHAWVGPGHGEIVRSNADRDYIIYHAWKAEEVGHGGGHSRRLLIERIYWDDQGWPHIGNGTPSGQSPLLAAGGSVVLFEVQEIQRNIGPPNGRPPGEVNPGSIAVDRGA